MTTQTTFPYEIIEGAPMSPEQDDPANQVTRSFEWVRGSQSSTTRPTESSLSSPWGSSIYTFMGVGPSLVTDCACVSHELLKHMDWHWQFHWQWVLASSVPRAPTELMLLVGWGDKWVGKTLSTQISVTFSPRLSQMPSYGFIHR